MKDAVYRSYLSNRGSKRAIKQAGEYGCGKIVYSGYRDDVITTAKRFGGWARDTYGIHSLSDVSEGHLRAYLDFRALSGQINDKTLKKEQEHMRVLSHCLGHNHEIAKEIAPSVQALKQEHYRTYKGLGDELYNTLLHDVGARSNTGIAMQIARYSGIRVQEIARNDKNPDKGLYAGDIIDKGDRVTLHVRSGKGGRYHSVTIDEPERIAFFRDIKSGKRDDERLVTCKVGSLEKTLGRWMEKEGLGDDFKFQKFHCIRKDWAQEKYDAYRVEHSKEDTIKHINALLAHGRDRDVSLCALYVDIY